MFLRVCKCFQGMQKMIQKIEVGDFDLSVPSFGTIAFPNNEIAERLNKD